jgi:hypothetical protein
MKDTGERPKKLKDPEKLKHPEMSSAKGSTKHNNKNPEKQQCSVLRFLERQISVNCPDHYP